MSAEKSKLALIKDFKLTCEEFENIITLIEYHDIEVASTTKSVKKAINKIGVELIKKWFILKQADRDDHIYPDSRTLSRSFLFASIALNVSSSMSNPNVIANLSALNILKGSSTVTY